MYLLKILIYKHFTFFGTYFKVNRNIVIASAPWMGTLNPLAAMASEFSYAEPIYSV